MGFEHLDRSLNAPKCFHGKIGIVFNMEVYSMNPPKRGNSVTQAVRCLGMRLQNLSSWSFYSSGTIKAGPGTIPRGLQVLKRHRGHRTQEPES